MATFVDHDFAGRIERLAAVDNREFARASAALFPAQGADWIKIAGGIAAYAGAGSPTNGAVGLGFAGEVTHADIELVERFYVDRREQPVISICPLAHPSLVGVLARRGWTVCAFENVLVREILADELLPMSDPGTGIRVCTTPDERELWAIMVANGFSAPDDPTAAELRLGAAATLRTGARLLLGLVDGEPAGTGELLIAGDIAWLSADTTLPRYRRRGVQRSLQVARLALARDAGCNLAITESMPGSASQRNMERLGFSVVYTRVDAVGPASQNAVPKGFIS